MAKRKTPKVKDLRPDRISDEQLRKLQEAVRTLQNYQNQIGTLETRKHEMLHVCFKVSELIDSMRQEFMKEFGSDEVSLEDGAIKYNKDEQSN